MRTQHVARRTLQATVILGLCAALLAAGCSSESPDVMVLPADGEGSYEYDYVIPAGTGLELDRGNEVEIVPQELDVEVGERIRIANDDDRGTSVGIFWVPAESTVAMEFTSPGELSGECDVHPSGEFTINVT